MRPIKLLKNSCSLQDVIYLTKTDYKTEGKISLYKLIIRPLFFLLTDGEIAHGIVVILGKIYGKIYRWIWYKDTYE
jgi:hypothetical protein